MDRQLLARSLELIGVPPDVVSLDEPRPGKFGIQEKADHLGETWQVVRLARNGEQRERQVAGSEIAARYLLLGRLGANWLEAVRDPTTELVPFGLPAEHGAVRVLTYSYDPHAGLGPEGWAQKYWPKGRRDIHGRALHLTWPDEYEHPDGFLSPDDRTPITLAEGAEVDQFGPGFGRLVFPAGTPFEQRALSPDYLAAGYHRYRVRSELPVWAGAVAPAFGQPGGAPQYFMLYSPLDLVHRGLLADITPQPTAPESPTELETERKQLFGGYGMVVSERGLAEQSWCLRRRDAIWQVDWIERGYPLADRYWSYTREGATHILTGRLVYSRLLAGGGYWS